MPTVQIARRARARTGKAAPHVASTLPAPQTPRDPYRVDGPALGPVACARDFARERLRARP